ncbi:MAG: PQQ-like beta-propeller repeat protein, partial [Deltaproteobacteria bacterium]|nr:PQQ-like beta-propeller repeat protein [Deltaproteobacteria bacterium]
MRKGYVNAIILLLLFIFSTGRAESQLDDNVWPMLHRDMFHTGSSPFGGPAVDKMIIRKIVDVQAGNASPIIGSDGTVYIGSQDGCVYAVDPAEHESICLFEAESPVEATPIIASDGSLYFAALSGSVYGLKPDGTQKWAPLLLGDTIKATPALGQNGVLYVAVEDNGGVLFAIDTETGSVLWEFALGDIGYLTPAIDQFGNIYAGTMQGSLFSISVTGTLRWRHDAGESIVASPVISPDGTVYIATASALHAFDGFDGALRWTYEPEAMVEGEPIPGTLASSPVLGPDGRIFFAGVEGDIHCIIEKDGSVTQQWSQTLDYPLLFGVKINALIFAAPLLDRNGVLYVRARQYTLEGDEQVVLYTLDVSSGEILGSFNEFEALDAAQASSQDTLLALGADATLYLVMSNGMLYVLGAEIDAYEVSGSIAQV